METLAPGSMIVGARLRIGAALGMPMSELVDRELDASELWGTRPLRLAEQCAGTPALACEMLERELLARLDAVPDPLVAETVRTLTSRGLERVGALPGRLHLSERQLNRRCLTATGLAPKLLQRMLRFQRFLALAHAGGLTRAGLARLAATAGYTDQPHLNRECARLTGVSPGTLLREAEMHCAGAHDHTPSYAPLLAQDV
jgi:AraC-like DNA-binding protein